MGRSISMRPLWISGISAASLVAAYFLLKSYFDGVNSNGGGEDFVLYLIFLPVYAGIFALLVLAVFNLYRFFASCFGSTATLIGFILLGAAFVALNVVDPSFSNGIL